MSETKRREGEAGGHDGACTCIECEEMALREIRQSQESRIVVGADHECFRGEPVVRHDARIVAECWTCPEYQFSACSFPSNVCEDTHTLLQSEHRCGLALTVTQTDKHRAAGHDVRPVEGKRGR